MIVARKTDRGFPYLIRFWILHSNWEGLNLFISCFIMVCLHGKVIVVIALKMFSLRSQFNIHNEVSFKIRHFKNILPFSSIPFTISEGK